MGKKAKTVLLAIGIVLVLICVILLINKTPENMTVPTESTTQNVTASQHDEIEDDVELILSDMTVEEKVYQMMFVTPESLTGVGQVIQAGNTTKEALEKCPVGGIIYFSQNIKSREQVTQMITTTQDYSKIPLFIGVDEEGGRVARIASKPEMETTKLGPMKNVKSYEEAYSVGQTLGKELKELSFNVDFAPVADVIIYEKNSEIGDRSFGTDPEGVAGCVGEVVKGLEENGVSSTLKHFPGHGSTKVDSHTGYSASERTLEELRQCEFLPFKKGIEAGCDFIMVSHMTLVNATSEKLPSSLSKEVITGYLKSELGFEGIVITDSLSMGAITQEYGNGEAAVMAIEAGNDMLLMPKDIKIAADAVIKAVNEGRISEERINESVRKILTIKKEKGMF